jgi:oxygen-independent coproporphyrinogen III oxidase
VSSPTSLYFHIPFCTRKCDYCHFYVIPDREADKELLMEGFFLEWQRQLPLLQNKRIISIYFGGGTPALLGPERIGDLLERIQRSCLITKEECEVTLEANPENLDRALMESYAAAGINRVSIGIQTLDDALLRRLGRIHTANKGLDAIYATAEAGISNISIDLMYDLPGQTLAHWEHTLHAIAPLPITHLSLYNLTIEPHTVFFKHRELLKKSIPNEEISLQMYEMAVDKLKIAGLGQYEISAFAKEGYRSRHNTGYWLARPFLGFGPSAFSDWQGKRFRNIAHLSRYLKALRTGESPVDFEEKLPPDARARELFVIALRLLEGVDLALFESTHGPLGEDSVNTLTLLTQQGLLMRKGSHFSLTRRGILFYDTVAADLI